MKASTKKKDYILIAALIISLLLHLSPIIYIILHPFSSTQSPHENIIINKKNDFDWVETDTRESSFGAPVFFKEKVEKPIHDTTEESKEVIVEKIEKIDAIPQDIKSEITVNQEIASPQIQTTPPLKQQITTYPPNKKTYPQTPIQPSTKPPLTLANLTKGFLNHINTKGNHAVKIISNKKGMASDEQLKHERYLEKLVWCLQNSFITNESKQPRIQNITSLIDPNVHVELVLNKNGTIRHINIVKSSGSMHLDRHILYCFNDASSAFPPIPSYLPHDPFTLHLTVVNRNDMNGMRLYKN